MSRLKMPQKKEAADKLVNDIIGFAESLHSLLNNRQLVSSESSRGLEKYMKQLPLSSHVSGNKARKLDALGTELWNTSAGLIHETQRDPRPKATDPVRQGVLIRVFAFLLLDAAACAPTRTSNSTSEELRIRALSIALRAARLCLDKDELQLAQKVLERCSYQATSEEEEDSLMQITNAPIERELTSESLMRVLTGEFHLLRLLHAWKSGRMDLADHHYPKVNFSVTSPTSNLHVKAADLFYEIAGSFAKVDKQSDAIKWFERAFQVSNLVNPEHLGQEGAELRLSIGVSFADILLLSRQPSHHQRAWEITDILERTHGLDNRLTIPILKFRVLANEQHADPEKMAQTLSQIVRLAVLTEDNFRMIMKTMRKASERSRPTAIHALRTFICTRLLPDVDTGGDDARVNSAWLEKATVAYILFHTKEPELDPQSSLEDLEDVFNTISAGISSPFTPKATHAAQTLLWKTSGQTGPGFALGWCHLLRHPLFESAGYTNKARIGRKLMCVALDERNATAAREAFFQMPESARNDSSSRFLAFKTALLSKDDDFAMESLEVIIKGATKDPTVLYACVLESQQSEKEYMTLAALQAVLGQKPPGIHMPAVLRCTARLLTSQLGDGDRNVDDIAVEAVKVFEMASQHIEELRQMTRAQWADELQWWSKNSYNYAVRHCKDMHPEFTLRILDVCMTFMDAYPNDTELRQQGSLGQRKLLCAFLATIALIVMGRSGEMGTEHTTQCFLHAQERIARFKMLQTKPGSKSTGQEALARSFTMLKLDLECIVHLQQWDRLDDTLRECLEVRPTERWDSLADLIIIMHEQLDASSQQAHSEMIVQVLQRIINDTWKKQKEITNVARWVRFTFTLCLNHVQGNFSFKLLHQAAAMAENGYRGKHDIFPESELQWLATTSFNRAIDFLVEEEKGPEAMQWMEAALALAKWSQDNGSLHAILTEKREVAGQHVQNQNLEGEGTR